LQFRTIIVVPGSGAMDDGANTFTIRLEYALVVTFLYGQAYECNEVCKYHKNVENPRYKFIPAVNRTYYDGSITHVTGIVNITAEDFERMPSRFDGAWLRSNFPHVAQSMDRFIAKIKQESNGEVVGSAILDSAPSRISTCLRGERLIDLFLEYVRSNWHWLLLIWLGVFALLLTT
jgi:hypothetical protein